MEDPEVKCYVTLDREVPVLSIGKDVSVSPNRETLVRMLRVNAYMDDVPTPIQNLRFGPVVGESVENEWLVFTLSFEHRCFPTELKRGRS